MDEHVVIVADTTGVICQWNKGAETHFGYRADQAIGHSLDLIAPEHSIIGCEVAAPLWVRGLMRPGYAT